MEEKFIFVVDTDPYAGNFERPLCGFMTGQVGDCGVGEEEAAEFEDDDSISEEIKDAMPNLIGQEPDDSGCHRPATIVPTPDYYNSGGNDHHVSEPEDKVLKIVRQTRAKYAKDGLKPYLRLLSELRDNEREDESIYWNERRLKEEIARRETVLEEAMAITEIPRYPAYLSVGIHMLEIPDDKTIDFLRDRAYTYASREPKNSWDRNFKITGFRLLTRRTVDESKEL